MRNSLRRAGRALLALIDLAWAGGALALCLAWWTGWMLKDSTRWSMWLYFIPPIAVIIAGAFWLYLTLRHRFRLLQLFVFLTIAACFVKVLIIDHRWNPPPAALPDDNLRVLHWNTAWGVLGVESIVRTITEDTPDIVLISEPPRIDMISDISYHALGMEHVFTDAGMTIASHYPIAFLGRLDLPSAAGWSVRVDTPNGPLEFAAVDVVSRPNLDRRPPLHALARWVMQRTNSLPLLVVGDFNTPHDSVAFRPLAAVLRQAYPLAGRGWPYTWPMPFPVFAIDLTWASPGISVHDAHLKAARYSDHKRQIIDLSLPAPPTTPDPAP
jgi:endonuclease/exonuclease/phosphatase (EEP) superfamily protein YafD